MDQFPSRISSFLTPLTRDTGCQVGAKKAEVSCFVGEAAHSTEAKIDCAGSELSRFQIRAIAQP